MNKILFKLAQRSHLAKSLAERLCLFRNNNDAAGCGDLVLAQRRLARWKKTPAFSNAATFAQFLKSEALSEEEFFRVLGAGPEDLASADNDDSAWLETFQEAFNFVPDAKDLDRLPDDPRHAFNGILKIPYPLILFFRNKLLLQVKVLIARWPRVLVDADGLVQVLEKSIHARLQRLLQRSFVLEANIARVENTTPGKTPEERFKNFIKNFDERGACLKFFQEYPVLARACTNLLQQWVTASAEFLDRLGDDYPMLQSQFGHEDLGCLEQIIGGVGDAHRNGRSVLVVQFSSGVKVVYKPRSVAVDVAFQNLLSWLNASGLKLPLRTIGVLERGDYGWNEFVTFGECKDNLEVEQFYERIGSLLAVLYLVGATDLHLENIIAAGSDPVTVDLETLFHPRLAIPDQVLAESIAQDKVVDSVMSIGLLPHPVQGNGRTMDTSGIGATPNQVLPFEVDGFEGIGTDEVKVKKIPGRIGETYNRPMLNGGAVSAAAYWPHIDAGFTQTYQLMLANRNLLLSSEGPFERFRTVPVRAVLRPSSTYGALLNESTHPNLLRNALDQELLFSQLWEEVARTPAYAAIIGSERRQLLVGDIPYFACRADSQDVEGGDGTLIHKALAVSGFEVARQRLDRLGDEDLDLQRWFIQGALLSLERRGALHSGNHAPVPFQSPMAAAEAIGERLAQSAILSGGTVSWLALKYVSNEVTPEDGFYRVGVTEYNLYSGLCGVTYFLAYLAKFSGIIRFKNLAEAALTSIEARVEALNAKRTPGAFNGISGLVFLYSHLSVLWEKTELLHKAAAFVTKIAEKIDNDSSFDVIGGTSGAIPILVNLGGLLPNCEASAAAVRGGEHLLSFWHRYCARKDDGEVAGSLPYPRGFAHGLSGFAWALGQVGAMSGEQRFLNAAAEAIRYESQLLLSEKWADIPGNESQAAWCHGAPGIALSRMKLHAINPRLCSRQECYVALEFLLQSPEQKNHTLCHGSLGNLEPLQVASHLFKDDLKWQREVAVRSVRILAEIGRSGWCSPLPDRLIEPGLMMGLSGMGVGMLRLAFPQQMPSVLTLEAPHSQNIK